MSIRRYFTLLFCTLLLAACGSSPRNSGYSSGYGNSGYATSYGSSAVVETGRIDNIQYSAAQSGSTGAGAIIGGLVGGVVGNQVGSGRGRTAATIAGAAGGAVVGNNVENSRNSEVQQAQIGIRLDNGSYRTIIQDDASGLRVGDRVRIVDGRVTRD